MADYPFAHALTPKGYTTSGPVFPESLLTDHHPSIDAVSFTLTAKDLHPETLALLTGMHPAHFDAEGHALVQKIIDKKEAQP